MMKNILLILFLFVNLCQAQTHLDQNGVKSSVIGSLYANEAFANRYEIATIGYNSHHWQSGGIIIVELFNQNFGTGFEKFIIELGYAQGTGSSLPIIRRTDSYGSTHNARILLGNPSNLSSIEGGYINKSIPLYLDLRYYSAYKVKLTYLRDRVEEIDGSNQIKINLNPTGVAIDDFAMSAVADNDLATSGNLLISGTGNHYISNGNMGIGTTTPDAKLAVNGRIHAQEVKVDMNGWADYVFEEGYKKLSLTALEKFIKENKHLPNMPTAKDVERNGLALGEIVKLQQEKIEELTLHLIEKDKAIKSISELYEDNKNTNVRQDLLLESLVERIKVLDKQKHEKN